MIICPKCKNRLPFHSLNINCSKCGYTALYLDGIVYFHPELDENCEDYDSAGIDNLYKVENIHFWFNQRKKIIKYIFRKYIPLKSSVIEIGGGTGNVARMLIDEGYNLSLCDIHSKGLRYAKKYGVENCYQFDLLQSPFVSEFDFACMFDVLEHFENEETALNNVFRLLNKNGLIVITVPAYNFLWNRDDAIAYHKRRYTKKYIDNILINNGFEIIGTKYFFASLIPFLLLRKLIKRDDGSSVREEEFDVDLKISPIINVFLNFILSIEYLLFKILPLPFGGSIITIAKKVV